MSCWKHSYPLTCNAVILKLAPSGVDLEIRVLALLVYPIQMDEILVLTSQQTSREVNTN
ncbi:hypothetical protein GDO86_005242 [Hymenochirus boettgeri]|uniref:Uncharacterized protein n=1 Tax=Hymenochirus boettgeri TaxID=247094 RepID=A0A8T2J6N4_9PIPI|nr:hypothetical protein GDO86_005242 [Hymenochirus boettgeri]